MQDKAFQDIINPIMPAFPKNEQLDISYKTIEDEVRLEAENIKKKIKEDLKKVCIYMMLNSGYSRSFLFILKVQSQASEFLGHFLVIIC